MNKIFYFSGSGKSRRLAEYFGKELEFPIFDITDIDDDFTAEIAVVVFPVYCQNIPEPMKKFLSELKAEKTAFAATYGKKSYGNVIEDAAKISSGTFIGGICIPCGHSFLSEPDDFDFSALSPFIERIKNPKNAEIKHCHKDFYADFLSAKRTQTVVKIIRKSSCINCGKCSEICPFDAIKNGKINKNCVCCLRCVTECPKNALEFKVHAFLKIYLENCRKNKNEYFF